jgi:hypothetical protein
MPPFFQQVFQGFFRPKNHLLLCPLASFHGGVSSGFPSRAPSSDLKLLVMLPTL